MFRSCRILCFTTWRTLQEVSHFDVCVIGGGPAGIAAALRAVDHKKKVCLIERERVGGCDLWNGALPSKTMWSMSNFLGSVRGAAAKRVYGVSMESYVEVDEAKMRASIDEVSRTRQNQIFAALAATDATLLSGQATFVRDDELACYNKEKKEMRKITADYFIIATGSRPREHPFATVDGRLVMTSDHIMQQPLPKKLVIVGAGVIGCEFASIFAGLGKTEVSIIDKAPHILPGDDRDLVSKVQEHMESRGVTIHHDSILYDLQAWEEDDGEMAKHQNDYTRRCGVQYTIMNRATRRLTTFNVDRALISIGREPQYQGLGLENTSFKTQDGRLLTDAFGKCLGSQNVFAVGDANSNVLLISMAEAKAKLAIDYIYGAKKLEVPHIEESLARVSFLTKTIASVGLNELECRRRNIAYVAAKVGYNLVSRPVAAANMDGFVKIIVSNDPERRIMGVGAIGMNASTLVGLGSLAIQNHQSAYDLADRLTAYPAASQAFQECLRAILGRSELKPGVFDTFTVTRWAPENYERGSLYQSEVKQHKDKAITRATEAAIAEAAGDQAAKLRGDWSVRAVAPKVDENVIAETSTGGEEVIIEANVAAALAERAATTTEAQNECLQRGFSGESKPYPQCFAPPEGSSAGVSPDASRSSTSSNSNSNNSSRSRQGTSASEEGLPGGFFRSFRRK